MAVSINRIAPSITCHAWNGDKTKVAICPNTNEVQIFAKVGNEFKLETTLAEHDSVVTGIDWAEKTNRLLTCSQDRNAYVWNYVKKDEKDPTLHWKPTLVILRIDRSATACKWSPKEDKFAVASGAKCISVCYFEPREQWWVSKHLRSGIESTITSIDWHPNNILLAAAGTDCKARVISGFLKGVDKREDIGATAFGKKLPTGTLLAEWKVGGWVQSIKWSPSGKQLAWVSQDSSIHFLDCPTEQHKLQSLPTRFLPFRDLTFIGENQVVAVGHDANPVLFSGQSANFKFERFLDEKKAAGAAQAGAKAMWQARTDMGSSEAGGDRSLETKHQNCVTGIRVVDGKSFSSSGVDGNLGLWPYAAVGLKA